MIIESESLSFFIKILDLKLTLKFKILNEFPNLIETIF